MERCAPEARAGENRSRPGGRRKICRREPPARGRNERLSADAGRCGGSSSRSISPRRSNSAAKSSAPMAGLSQRASSAHRLQWKDQGAPASVAALDKAFGKSVPTSCPGRSMPPMNHRRPVPLCPEDGPAEGKHTWRKRRRRTRRWRPVTTGRKTLSRFLVTWRRIRVFGAGCIAKIRRRELATSIFPRLSKSAIVCPPLERLTRKLGKPITAPCWPTIPPCCGCAANSAS